jgi:co-chaperonin GroES (HSP10)
MNTEEPVIVDRRRFTADGLPNIDQVLAEVEAEQASILTPDTVYDSPVPIFNRILVLRQAKEAIWKGTRIIVPDIAQKDTNRGIVVAVSEHYIVNGVQHPMKELVKPGDLVTFGPFNVDTIEVDGQVYGLCTIFDVQLIQSCHYAVEKAAQ